MVVEPSGGSVVAKGELRSAVRSGSSPAGDRPSARSRRRWPGRGPGRDPQDWTPREMRHSFVSLLSDSGMPIEAISRLVGHRNTTVAETVYRKQLRPVILGGAEAMDRIFDPDQ